MPRRSAGLLLYRRRVGRTEVFLVHPGGPFWARRDEGAWSIPKGEYGEDEEPLAAARREFAEETGLEPPGDAAAALALRPLRQAGGKWVHAWAVEGDCDPGTIRSNTFTLEWPPRSGREREFPEVDRASWFDLSAARRAILKSQRPLLDELDATLSGSAAADDSRAQRGDEKSRS